MAPVDGDETDIHVDSEMFSSDSEEMQESARDTSRVMNVNFMREQTIIDSEGNEKEENEKEHRTDSEVAKNDSVSIDDSFLNQFVRL